jgi:hypothetical protein
LFAPWFRDPASWEAWRAFLAVLFNLPMDDAQIAIARACTGLEALPEQAFTEAWLVVGPHKDKEVAVLDCVREVRPPFSPESVTRDFAITLKSYRVNRVIGDRYAGEWVTEQFKSCGITYEPAEQAKSDIYRDVLPLINSGKVELLDLAKLEGQFVGLERRTARGGRDSIDHAPGGHDDLVNAACGALLRAGSHRPMRINPESLRKLLNSPPMPGSPNYGRRGPDPGWRVA